MNGHRSDERSSVPKTCGSWSSEGGTASGAPGRPFAGPALADPALAGTVRVGTVVVCPVRSAADSGDSADTADIALFRSWITCYFRTPGYLAARLEECLPGGAVSSPVTRRDGPCCAARANLRTGL